MDEKEHGYLELKWGTLKGWEVITDEELKLLEKYHELGASLGCATQDDSPEQKDIICKLIDLCNDPKGIYLSWDGEYVSKDKAKKYVMEYGKEAPKKT